MDRTRLPPTVGIFACLAFLGVLAAPFGSPSAGVYYASGLLNPLAGGLVALVTIIVFAAGRQGRTDAALAAGVAVAFGLIVTVTTIVWAFTARTDVLSMTPYHRHVLVGTAALVPMLSIWYARELGVI